MSEVELALNVVFILLNIPLTVVIMLMIDGHFEFEKYKSLVTAVQRNGVTFSLNDEKRVVYRNQLSASESIDVMASLGHHRLTNNNKPRDPKHSPWRHEYVNGLSGELQDLSLGEHPLYRDARNAR